MKIGLKTIGCLGCFGILVLCGFSIFIIIARPTFIWNHVVNFVNNDLTYPDAEVKDPEIAEEEILEQIQKVEANDIYITEAQLTSIAKDRLAQIKDITFDIKDDLLIVYWKLDDSEKPIFGEINFRVKDENNLELVKLGTPRISLPGFLYPPMIDFIQRLAEGIGSNDSIISALKTDSSLRINKITLEEDRVVLNVSVNVNLFEND